MTAPLLIPVFLPHQGCPFHCIFCDQHLLATEKNDLLLSPARVTEEVRTWLDRSRTADRHVEVAFYGGSFTMLPPSVQTSLLAAISPFVAAKKVHAIRVSTRPDGITAEKLSLLQKHNVTTVELGVQSMTPNVLVRSRRGHTREQVISAVRLLRDRGFTIGLQLLPGLPGETTASCLASARAAAALNPDFVRLYPALVLPGTELARMHQKGEYTPLSLKKAVLLCSRLREIFIRNTIPVIRTGIQPTDALAASSVLGPFHPSFGELVLAHCAFRTIARMAGRKTAAKQEVTIHFNPADSSIVHGHKKNNTIRWRNKGIFRLLHFVADDSLPRHHLLVDGQTAIY